MQMFRSTGIRFSLLILIFLAGVTGFVLPARAEVYRRPLGDTVVISRPLPSTFHRWEIEDFSGNYFQNVDEIVEEERQVQFVFQAVEAGTESLHLRRLRRTAFVEEVDDTAQITLVSYAPEEPDVPEEVEEPEEEIAEPEPEDPRDRAEREALAEVDELLEIERYEAARELIHQQIDGAEDEETEIRWLNKLAESYYAEEDFEQAIASWEEMVESFPEESPASWLYRIAESYREMDEDDEAELLLLRIRHRHRATYRWSDAMKMLAEIAIDRENYERAASILESLRAAYRQPTGDVLLELARLYDRFEPVRDYERAVEYYRQAARQLQNEQPDRAREVNRRADYLEENYVGFGVD